MSGPPDDIAVHRCEGDADERACLELYNRVWRSDSLTLDEARHYKQASLAYEDFLARAGGEAVGSLLVTIRPYRPDVGLALLTVAAERRGRGAGTALLAAAGAWLGERGLGELEALVPESDEASFAWAQRRGFREVERNSRLVLELSGYEPPAVDPPQGIEIVTWAEQPALARGLYEVACEAFPDIPGGEDEVMEPFADWLEHEMHGPGDRPETTFVALAGDEVVGYAKFAHSPARPSDADHDITGVRRAWRGRGVAGALKRAQIAWAKEAGYERLVTQNEVRNGPIRQLNERFGYRIAPGRIIVRGPIGGSLA